MSSWDQYISNMKIRGLKPCGIFGNEGGCWASSPELEITQQEVLDIVKGLNDQNFPDGLHIGGVKHMIIALNPEAVTAKVKGSCDENKKFLVHVSKAKTCVIIGGMCGPNERDTTKIIEEIREHLAKSGY